MKIPPYGKALVLKSVAIVLTATAGGHPRVGVPIQLQSVLGLLEVAEVAFNAYSILLVIEDDGICSSCKLPACPKALFSLIKTPKCRTTGCVGYQLVVYLRPERNASNGKPKSNDLNLLVVEIFSVKPKFAFSSRTGLKPATTSISRFQSKSLQLMEVLL